MKSKGTNLKQQMTPTIKKSSLEGSTFDWFYSTASGPSKLKNSSINQSNLTIYKHEIIQRYQHWWICLWGHRIGLDSWHQPAWKWPRLARQQWSDPGKSLPKWLRWRILDNRTWIIKISLNLFQFNHPSWTKRLKWVIINRFLINKTIDKWNINHRCMK